MSRDSSGSWNDCVWGLLGSSKVRKTSKTGENLDEKNTKRMDLNLERIGDIMAEIERQLKPLRIKAKRAAAYDGLIEELKTITTQLAVDDLKKIKKQQLKAMMQTMLRIQNLLLRSSHLKKNVIFACMSIPHQMDTPNKNTYLFLPEFCLIASEYPSSRNL